MTLRRSTPLCCVLRRKLLASAGRNEPARQRSSEPTQAGSGGMRGPGVLNVIPVIAFTLRFP